MPSTESPLDRADIRPGSPALPLDDAGVAYQQMLEAVGKTAPTAFDVRALDHIGIPTWAASVPLPGGGLGTGFGYGLTDSAALTGALGELAEEVQAAAVVPDLAYVEGSWEDLTRAGVDAVHPWALCLEAGSDVGPATFMRWVAAERRSDGAQRWVPIEFVACHPGELPDGYQPAVVPITNGLGAHLSRDGALRHGLLELIQRDGNGLCFRALDAGRVITFGAGEPPGPGQSLLAQFDDAGLKIQVKLASTEWGIANLYAVGYDGDIDRVGSIAMSAGGEAADPDPAKALSKALLEFAASRARKLFAHGSLTAASAVSPAGYMDSVRSAFDRKAEEDRALDAMVEWLKLTPAQLLARLEPTVFSARESVPWSSVTEAAAAATAPVWERLEADGFAVLVVDLSPADGPVKVVKVIVPGLEVETISYHRIGERNVARLVESDRGCAGIGSPPPGSLAVRLTEQAEERLGGQAWVDVDRLDQLAAGHYPLYREPGRHAAPLVMEPEGPQPS